MNSFETLSVADRFKLSLEGLCRAVAARIAPGIAGWAMQAVMIRLVWTRIRRAEGKILALLARFQAGRLRVMPAGRVVVRSGPSGGAVAPQGTRLPRDPTAKLPRSFAWLCVMVPYEAAGFASQLRVVLAEPEMQGLLGASAQARRVMAPLCRMLGIEAEVLTPQVAQPAPEAAPVKSVVAFDVPSALPDPPGRAGPHWIRWGGD